MKSKKTLPAAMELAQRVAMFRTADIRVKSVLPAGSSEFRFLIYLANAGPTRPSALGEAFRCSRAFVSKVVRALERRGWVARSRDSGDGRSFEVAPTRTGLEVARGAMDDYARTAMALIESMGEKKAEAFGRLLEEATRVLNALRDGAEEER